MGLPSGSEWIILVLVVVIIFGASRLPLLGRNLGQGIKEFRKGVSEARADKKQAKSDQAARPADQDTPPSAATQPPPPPADGQTTDRIADRRD